jgi:hypothetical protein
MKLVFGAFAMLLLVSTAQAQFMQGQFELSGMATFASANTTVTTTYSGTENENSESMM